MNDFIWEILKIGGPAACIVALFLYFWDKKDARITNLVENHLNHNTQTISRMERSLTKLSLVIERLTKCVDKLVNR